MQSSQHYDLIVIGSGPAGIHAAVQAAKLKKRVCVVEQTPRKIGGCWVHWGTLPSKTMRESLAAIHSIRSHAGKQWVDRVIDDLHTGKLFGRAQQVSQQEEQLIHKYLAKNKIKLVEGYGVIEDRFHVRVMPADKSSFVLSCDYILIATGSKPRRPEEIPFDGWRVVDSDEVLCLEQLPRSMVIYGAGIVGCEYACIFGALGINVTLVDSRERVMLYLDAEIGEELRSSMETLGIKFELGRKLIEVAVDGPLVNIVCAGLNLDCEVFFFASGRISCSQRIGISRVGIYANGNDIIPVNKNFQTQISNIYAAGDVIGPPALAATSSQQGRFVACHAFGAALGAFPSVYPIGVYTIPELSMVGKTEEHLKKDNIDYVVGRAYYSEIARGYIRGDSHGLLKLLICKKTHRILGLHIVGDDACNLIHIGLAFMINKGCAQDLLNFIFNYPTLAEGYRIAAFNGLNKIFTDGKICEPPKNDDDS